MISSEKTQNAILIVTILVALVSGISLASNAGYYSGSYALAQYIEVDLVEIRVARLDPTNTSMNPGVFFTLNFQTPNETEGNARLQYITLSFLLNAERISLPAFSHSIPYAEQPLYGGYDMNYTLSASIMDLDEKQILYNALTDDAWIWSVTVDYFYAVFDSDSTTQRTISFSYDGVRLT
ncbi:MAG: hypothetical protein ACFE7R_11125 [Candidatus Hodarchaeota archaeon]